jgi:hypothetical protein
VFNSTVFNREHVAQPYTNENSYKSAQVATLVNFGNFVGDQFGGDKGTTTTSVIQRLLCLKLLRFSPEFAGIFLVFQFLVSPSEPFLFARDRRASVVSSLLTACARE